MKKLLLAAATTAAIVTPAGATELLSTTYVARDGTPAACTQTATAALIAMYTDHTAGGNQNAVYATTGEFAIGINCVERGRLTVVVAGPQLSGVRSVLTHFEFIYFGNKRGPSLPSPSRIPRSKRGGVCRRSERHGTPVDIRNHLELDLVWICRLSV
jgi:hypothetical protein